MQKCIDVGQILIGDNLGSIGRHLPGRLSDIALDHRKRDGLGTKPRSCSEAALRFAAVALIATVVFEKLSTGL